MEAMAQRRGSMDDSFHLPNFPHMAWVDLSALPTIVIMPSLRARDECTRIESNLKDIAASLFHSHHPYVLLPGVQKNYELCNNSLEPHHHTTAMLNKTACHLPSHGASIGRPVLRTCATWTCSKIIIHSY